MGKDRHESSEPTQAPRECEAYAWPDKDGQFCGLETCESMSYLASSSPKLQNGYELCNRRYDLQMWSDLFFLLTSIVVTEACFLARSVIGGTFKEQYHQWTRAGTSPGGLGPSLWHCRNFIFLMIQLNAKAVVHKNLERPVFQQQAEANWLPSADLRRMYDGAKTRRISFPSAIHKSQHNNTSTFFQSP